MPDIALHQSLTRLVGAQHPVTLARIWHAIPVEQRVLALEATLAHSDSASYLREMLVVDTARACRFREGTVDAWPDSKLCAMASSREYATRRVASYALHYLHASERNDLKRAFLDSLRIPHTDGSLEDEAFAGSPLDADVLAAAFRELAERFPFEQVTILSLTMQATYPVALGNAREALQMLLADDHTPPIVDDELVEYDPVTPDPPEPLEFTTLDRRFIRAIVDCAGGVDGAPEEDELDDMLRELLHLNGDRHRTFFLIGFRDAVFGGPYLTQLPAHNESRERWYASGYVCGLGRRAAPDEICALYDGHPAVRHLGDRSDGAAYAGCAVVFRALMGCARYLEAGRFVSDAAVAVTPQLPALMLESAIMLLRENQADAALPLLDTLRSYARSSAVRESSPNLSVEVERRRATCLRLQGKHEEARQLLDALLSTPDQKSNAIASTELGLISGGFKRLGDLIVPHDKEGKATLLASIKKGEQHFRAALPDTGFRSSHAAFVIGLLELLEKRYESSANLLSEALRYFGGLPQVYDSDGTLSLTKLYLGIAVCNGLGGPSDMRRAADLLADAVSGGAQMPLHLVADTVTAVGLVETEKQLTVVNAIAERGDDEVLDILAKSGCAPRARVVVQRLAQRALDTSRAISARVQDAATVTPWLAGAGETDKALDLLGFLEASAIDGTAVEEYLTLLQKWDDLSSVISRDGADESRARVLSANNRTDEAMAVLTALAMRVCSSEDAERMEVAAALITDFQELSGRRDPELERMHGVLTRRLEAGDVEESTAALTSEENISVNILVVGGNEQQVRMQSAIQQEVARTMPNVSVEFMPTGWSGNWGDYLSEFRRRSRKVDGVVMLTMMRTMLAYRIRAAMTVPWSGTRARGQGGIVEAVRRAVVRARQVLRSKVES